MTQFWALMILAGLLILCPSIRRPRRAPARYRHVGWRVLWWRKAAPAAAVRRRCRPLERELAHLRPLAELLHEPDAEEGDHAALH